MAAHGVARGETVATVQGEHDRQPWVLSRAVKINDGENANEKLQ